MANFAFRAEQEADLYLPHIAPVNELVDQLFDADGLGWLPHVAPMQGGTNAKVLSILRDPGPATQLGSGSGMLCLENDDPSAAWQLEQFEKAGISPALILPWNAYPWYVNRSLSAAERQLGVAPLVELITIARVLEVILLQG